MNHLQYIVKVTATYQGPAAEDSIIYLNASVQGSLCGSWLGVGREYNHLIALDDVQLDP